MPGTVSVENTALGKELADKFIPLHGWISQ